MLGNCDWFYQTKQQSQFCVRICSCGFIEARNNPVCPTRMQPGPSRWAPALCVGLNKEGEHLMFEVLIRMNIYIYSQFSGHIRGGVWTLAQSQTVTVVMRTCWPIDSSHRGGLTGHHLEDRQRQQNIVKYFGTNLVGAITESNAESPSRCERVHRVSHSCDLYCWMILDPSIWQGLDYHVLCKGMVIKCVYYNGMCYVLSARNRLFAIACT